MAPSRLPPVLALEIPFPWRPTANRLDLRALIRRMSVDNPLWGAPRIDGELLKLGFEVASPASRSIWSSDADRPPLDGAPSCAAMRPTSPLSTCSRPDHWF